MARSTYHQWFSIRTRFSKRTKVGQSFNRRLRIEPLEDRRLLALVTVDTILDTVDAADGVTSLREAITSTNAAAGADEIQFSASLTAAGAATITLTEGELPITDALTINGPGANLLTIDASGNDPTPDSTLDDGDATNDGDGSRVFNVDDGINGNLLDVSIGGLTLTGGDVGGNSFGGGGGAIRSFENVSVTDSAISGNTATRGGGINSAEGKLNVTRSSISGNSGGAGGGIQAGYGSITAVDSTINENSAASGGGIYLRDGNLTLIGTSISGNSASNSNNGGGGIKILNSFELSGIVTITDSTISGNSTGGDGGGIRLNSATNGSLTITSSTITGNSAGRDGGGMRLIGGSTFITDCTMSGNSAGVDGGAISSSGILIVTRSTLVDNSAQAADTSVGRGGAIWTSRSGSLTIVESTISGNSASGHGGGIYHGNNATLTGSTIKNNTSSRNGGGIVSYRGNLTVTGSTITRNSAAADGGGIHGRNSGTTTTTVTGSTISYNSASVGSGINCTFGTLVVTESVLNGNRAGLGGGIRQFNGSLTLSNSTISGNSATGNSGGLDLFTSLSSQFAIRHSTIVSNTASGFGGGISVFGGSLDLDHTILAQNTASLGRDLIPFLGAVIDTQFNLIGDNADSGLVAAPVGSPDANGNLIGTATSPIIPLLRQLTSNGGPTMTHALVVGSPAIDAGDPDFVLPPEFDQRGAPFVRINGDRIDIGAYERQSLPTQSFVVDSLIDESDGDYSVGDCSLRETIELANGSVGSDTITFAASLVGSGPATIMLTHGELHISESLSIDGPGQNLLTIDASGNDPTPDVNNGDGSGVFTIEDYLAYPNQPQVQNVAFSDLTLTGGDGSGAIRTGENLTVTNCTISGNSSSFAGGGILVNGSNASLQLSVIRTTISDNAAFGNIGGGGIAAFGATMTVTDSAITGNSSVVEGGGITNYRGNLTVSNSTISGNSAVGGGGGISTRSGGTFSPATLTVTNSTISGNSSTGIFGNGGGIIRGSGGGSSTVTVRNSIVAGNTGGAGAASDVAGTVTLAFSLLGVTSGAGIIDNGGNLIGTAAEPIDPLLGALADNGGPTMTHALLSGSPAIDAGNPAAVAGMGGVPEFDQRGEPFNRVAGGRIDIGALESQPNPLPGDYNFDGTVSAADYTVWRDTLGSSTDLRANGDENTVIDNADYDVWAASFGNTLAVGASIEERGASILVAGKESSSAILSGTDTPVRPAGLRALHGGQECPPHDNARMLALLDFLDSLPDQSRDIESDGRLGKREADDDAGRDVAFARLGDMFPVLAIAL